MKKCKWVTGEFEELCVNPDCWNCNYFCVYEYDNREQCKFFDEDEE